MLAWRFSSVISSTTCFQRKVLQFVVRDPEHLRLLIVDNPTAVDMRCLIWSKIGAKLWKVLDRILNVVTGSKSGKKHTTGCNPDAMISLNWIVNATQRRWYWNFV